MKKVYVAFLNRFGYDLTVAAQTKKDAIDALMAEYADAYKKMNDGEDPEKEISDSIWNDEGKTFYEMAKEDIIIEELTLGKVEWR